MKHSKPNKKIPLNELKKFKTQKRDGVVFFGDVSAGFELFQFVQLGFKFFGWVLNFLFSVVLIFLTHTLINVIDK
jgi:hypothetical protein